MPEPRITRRTKRRLAAAAFAIGGPVAAVGHNRSTRCGSTRSASTWRRQRAGSAAPMESPDYNLAMSSSMRARKRVLGDAAAFILAAAAAAAWLASPVAGAHIPGPQDPQRPAAFGAAVDLVLVDITVTNSDGSFVHGLTKDDFRIFEEGEEMEIRFFALEKFASPEIVSGDPAIDELPSLARYIVVFVDGMNTGSQDWLRVRPHLRAWIENDLQPNDHVMLTSLHPDGRVLMTPDFSRDPETLIRALDQIETNASLGFRLVRQELYLADILGLEATLPNSGGATADSLRQGAELARTYTNERRREVRGTLENLSGLADHLALTFQVPGPKVVIMVSGGLPEIPGMKFGLMVEEQLEETSPVVRQRAGIPTYQPTVPGTTDDNARRDLFNAIGRFNRSNYLFYTIDARGTSAPRGASLSPASEALAASNERGGLISLADATGGLAFFNTNDFSRALARVQEDTAFRYVLGYAPPPHDPEDIADGKAFEVEVDVLVPGVEIRARNGYVDRGS